MTEYACPILPSADFDRTTAFYARFGFETEMRLSGDGPGAPYLILSRAPLYLHFAAAGDAGAGAQAVYIVTADADGWGERLRALGLPQSGVPRFEDVANMPWARRECAIVDPDGNRLRFGAPLPEEVGADG